MLHGKPCPLICTEANVDTRRCISVCPENPLLHFEIMSTSKPVSEEALAMRFPNHVPLLYAGLTVWLKCLASYIMESESGKSHQKKMWRNTFRNDMQAHKTMFMFTRNVPTCHPSPEFHGPRLRLPMLMAVATHQSAMALCWLEVGQRVDLRHRGIQLGFVTLVLENSNQSWMVFWRGDLTSSICACTEMPGSSGWLSWYRRITVTAESSRSGKSSKSQVISTGTVLKQETTLTDSAPCFSVCMASTTCHFPSNFGIRSYPSQALGKACI